MEIDEYLAQDPDFRILNKSLHESMNLKQNNSSNQPNLRGNFLLRQELTNYTPECTPKFVIACHIILLIISISCAFPLLLHINHKKVEIEYDGCATIDEENPLTGKVTKTCTLSFSLDEDFTPPIYVYYKLNKFYSNHREYVKSKIYPQLRGENITSYINSDKCNPMKYNKDLFNNEKSMMKSYTGKQLHPNDISNPCGLIARIVFNDTFKVFRSGRDLIPINEDNIAYASDKKYIYKRPYNSEDVQWIDVMDEHFMVWMNTEVLPEFLKKWGSINQTLPKGAYTVQIEYNWEVGGWGTKKYFVIVQAGIFGDALFFGYALITMGVFALGVVVVVAFLGFSSKEKFEPEKLNWK